MRWVKKVVRSAPLNAQNLHLQAGLYWQQQKREEALELYRFAACLNDKEERYANSYFIAARHLNRTETAIAFLQDRFQRFGDKSWLPVRTLFQALEQTGQRNQAFTALSEGLAMRPDDGALKLYAAESYARYGKFDQAVALLNEAQNQASHNEWLRTAALIATYRGQLGEALLHWLQVADAEALALDANSNVAQLLAETEGQQAALDFLRDRTMLYPHSSDLRQLLIEWLLNDPAAAEKELRRLIEIDPANDAKYARMHKRIMEQGRISKRESEVQDVLIDIKQKTDEKVLLNTNLLNNDGFFSGLVMQLLVGSFDKIKVSLEPDSAKFINNLLVREYINEFQGV